MMKKLSGYDTGRGRVVDIAISIFLFLAHFQPVIASQHAHKSHQRLHKRSSSLSSAEQTVTEALQALRIANRLRIENSQFNNYEFENSTGNISASSAAIPLLDYIDPDPAKQEAVVRLRRRQSVNGSEAANPNPIYGYALSPDIITAAQVVAESEPPTPWEVDYAAIAAQIRARYSLNNNDTNTMTQQLANPSGLLEYTPFEQSRNLQGPLSQPVTKRAESSYWMANTPKNGASPFAPAGYKVWRNVKDYGAVGDGVTDDTAAINKAISDGGRCGENCGSSTIYPAVVWFPAGTYLVSSSIIQYYNTQLLGDPTNVPTILAAASFVGLGVITSDVYVGETEQWYLNTNNFLRSIRNFKMDITRTDQSAYVCAIHWQVAQGTSLENIEFYMLQNVEGNTQQGIYMENGSGGFLADLTFVGGNFGAYFGNQQFTTSHLVFVNCKTALQVHWDWAWTMQDVIIESCGTGLVVVGGAGGPLSTGQGVGSLILVDAIIANTPKGIVTTLYTENSTSLLLQNVGFFNVQTPVSESALSRVLLAGGDEVLVDNWGFGRVTNSNGTTQFVNAASIPVMNRTASLLSSELAYVKPNFYTRRRPRYTDIGASQIINIKTAGAKGDGKTDDTTALNNIFAAAANMSSIVYIPFGVYMITDTVTIPVGSRVIGQAWPQIMAKGPKFAKQLAPHPAVRVGEPGQAGVVEIQDIMFTVSGPTAGAVLLQWNVHETTQGSAAMWDSHFRVGGAIGSNLQSSQCPKGGGVNTDCIAASTLLHMTSKSSAYLENIWVWVADHDLDAEDEGQIDVFSGRGVLIESQGPSWLYGTASEHNVLYQYQLSNASNVLMGMIQTESPYYQPFPKAPSPMITGTFPNDPTFEQCESSSITCAMSWAVRVVDSSSIYLLGAGLYSWFSQYSQDCLETENCQSRGFEVEQSYDIWIYNLVTKAIVEMISPVNDLPTLASENVNGFMSSILGWLKGSENTTGERVFPGFQIHSPSGLPSSFSDDCVTAMTATIKCHEKVFSFGEPAYRGSLGDPELTDAVCDQGCGDSLARWFKDVERQCAGYSLFNYPPQIIGGYMWAGWNETCFKDQGVYCNDVIQNFTKVAKPADMPKAEICSTCYIQKMTMMQSSSYSYYDEFYQATLQLIGEVCEYPADYSMPPSLAIEPPDEEEPFCLSGNIYTSIAGDTCTSISLDFSVSSASLYMGNQDLIFDCNNVTAGTKLCLPLSCARTYVLQDGDTCRSIEKANAQYLFDEESGLGFRVRQLNPWINLQCTNLQQASNVYGKVLCFSPQAGLFNTTDPVATSSDQWALKTGYGSYPVQPPEGATVAAGTSLRCNTWHVAAEGETCASICMQDTITNSLFVTVNPSLDPAACSESLQIGQAYCTAPSPGWNYTLEVAI